MDFVYVTLPTSQVSVTENIKDKTVSVRVGNLVDGSIVLLSLNKAVELQEKLLKEITQQRAKLAGLAAIKLLVKRKWVKSIFVIPKNDGEINLFVWADDGNFEIEESQLIGRLLSRVVEAFVRVHIMDFTRRVENENAIPVYVRPD